jgi:hypothetical protein
MKITIKSLLGAPILTSTQFLFGRALQRQLP